MGGKRMVDEGTKGILTVGEDDVMTGGGVAEYSGGYGLCFDGEGGGDMGEVSD